MIMIGGYRVGLNGFVAKSGGRVTPDMRKTLGGLTRGVSAAGSAPGITMRLDARGRRTSVTANDIRELVTAGDLDGRVTVNADTTMASAPTVARKARNCGRYRDVRFQAGGTRRVQRIFARGRIRGVIGDIVPILA
ncbi:hypothetical protein [Qingshengfaniella alkalisoli]|uniref:Uncharacterized protein n=1 Tax=Qingshengfaniella alkalisoli TaxID=2599296 RepID=A0A5B8IRR3_9RHOB|nr:hypothetical protein [Qingshengfaniella alkalisoli]QDY68264.1 hypothetical protein FPZ52_00605 [Qingshengfaniella alkalisoli]